LVAGAGFYTDAYDIFAVNFANVMVGYVYFPETGKLSTSQDTALKVGTSAGTVIGQLVFGFLADFLGRKKVSSVQFWFVSRLDIRN
jgi:MFS transporter, PHS family, inorganic phosphate transporter